MGVVLHRYKSMNSSFAAISTLIKSDIGEKCLINFLMNISAQALRDYLECANIYKGTSPKKKTDLIEMIVYGCNFYLNYAVFLSQINYFYVLNFIPSILFFKIFCRVCSLNSKCEKDSNILFNLINLFFNGFTAAYLLSFNLTICALLVL